jgi:hypothetical protein
MSGMASMGNGVPSLFYMQQIFWAFIGTAIAVGTLSNVVNKILSWQRISSSRTVATAAKPKSLFFKIHATLAAIIREYGYYSYPLSFRTFRFYLPPMGPTTILLGYFVLIIVSCLYKLDPKDLLEWEDIAYRAGFIAMCQIPLVVLLAGKRNIIGFLTGVGYERLNWLHRWVARLLLLTVIIHVGFWLTEWLKYDYVAIKIQEDEITQKGFIAGGILLWLIVSAASPIRGLSYEIFVVQHIISWLAFLITLYTHVPAENQIWIWLPAAFWLLDRLVRAVLLMYTNLGLFHGNSSGLLACKATFEPLDESHTRITISKPSVSWEAGQHMFLACHALAPLTSHPFTIASLPTDEKMEFIVCAKKGATRRFHRYASKSHSQLPAISSSSDPQTSRAVLLDGPYSRIRPLRQFDSILFLAGSTGATFTVPLMRDIVRQWTNNDTGVSKRFAPPSGAVTRYIRFVWVVKQANSAQWFKKQFEKVLQDVEYLKNEGFPVAVEICIYVTSNTKSPLPAMSVALNPSLDEKAGVTNITPGTPNERPLSTISSISLTKTLTSGMTFHPGRPNVLHLISETAEQALGEMAVVCCGPAGMVQDGRNAAVKCSDERAVHKGTGAQGIYVHAEAFGYA